MKEYEVVREIFNNCAGRWELDVPFTKEIECDDPEAMMRSWLTGNIPPYDTEILSDGTIVYTLKLPVKVRYSFSEF